METVGIALYGIQGHQITGYLGKLSRAKLTAVAGVDETWFDDRRKGHPDVFSDARFHTSLDDLLADPDVDLISFCSPRRADQAQQAVAALRAGKHVLAEKPMATTWSDLEALRAAVEESGRELRTMTTMIYDANVTGMKEVVHGGAAGEIVQVYVMKSYPYHDGRPQDRAVDGGIILQAGIHAVSLVRYVTGLEFVEVFAHDTGTSNPKPGDLQMACTITGKLSNGAIVTILCNYCNPKGTGYWGNDQLRVHGTAGMVEMVDGFQRRALVIGEAPAIEFPDFDPPGRYPQDLVDCILDGTPTLLTCEDSFRNTEVVLRAAESAVKRMPLASDLR